MRLARVQETLPRGFAELRHAAEGEGNRNMARLEAEWRSRAQRFDGPGEALLGAWLGEALAGVGGITREPSQPDGAILRLRRFYVHPRARRSGVARAIAGALIEQAREPLITLNAGGDSAPFWERLGFAPVEGRPWTHEMRPYSAA